MPAKQGIGRNKIVKISLLGFFTALCVSFGFLESLLPLDFIAPGIKIGLSNSVVLILIFFSKPKDAFFVNTVRIIICALAFGNVFSLCFSLPAGLISLIATVMLKKTKLFSIVGISIISATVHNITQLFVAFFFVSSAVLYYLPILLISGAVGGAVIGIITELLSKKSIVKKYLLP